MTGPPNFGIYSLGFTLVLLITCVQRSVISTPYTVYGNRLQGRQRAEYAGSVLIHYGLLSALAMICLALSGAVLSTGVGPPELAPVIWVLVGVIPFVLLREFGRRLAFSHLHMVTALVMDLAVATIQIIGLVALAASGLLSAVTAHTVVGLACAAGGVAWLVLARTNFVVRRERVAPDIRRNWSFGRWVFASQMISSMNVQVIPWLLMLMLDTAATGLYAACMTVVLFSNPFVLGVANVLEPRAARAFVEGGGVGVRRVVWKGTLLLGSVMVAFCGLVVLFGGQVVSSLFGSEYTGHETTLVVLAIAKLAVALGMGANAGVRALERPDVGFKANLLGLCLTLVIAVSLATSLGILGAAIGLLAGNVVASAVRCAVFFRMAGTTPWRRVSA
ncbi:MAG: oligosaccharide flippase family protein [Planctomycetes bacterium]|nr:oligosaccharide flippase family protein [Planctomycetota bacterium]